MMVERPQRSVECEWLYFVGRLEHMVSSARGEDGGFLNHLTDLGSMAFKSGKAEEVLRPVADGLCNMNNPLVRELLVEEIRAFNDGYDNLFEEKRNLDKRNNEKKLRKPVIRSSLSSGKTILESVLSALGSLSPVARGVIEVIKELVEHTSHWL